MQIENYISNLLLNHDCVIVPGLGGFVKNPSPAKWDSVANRFFPPYVSLSFNSKLTQNDGLLINAICTEEKLTYAKAKEAMDTYVKSLIFFLNNNEKVWFENIGTIQKDRNVLRFIPIESDVQAKIGYFPVLHLEEKNNIISMPDIENRTRDTAIWFKAASVFLFLFNVSLIWLFTNQSDLNFQVAGFDLFSNSTVAELYQPRNNSTSVSKHEAQQEIKKLNESTYDQLLNIKESSSFSPKPETMDLKIDSKFQIIAGCFKSEENAARQVEDLKIKGIDAYYFFDQTFYKISLFSTNSKTEALQKIAEVKQKFEIPTWIFEKV